MKPHRAEMHEGPEAFDRFRKAMKTIVFVRKSDILDHPKRRTKKKKPASHKG
ncbi:MAG: hypothetical protein ACREB3_03025 [Burkholderiales bacterium]